MKKIIPIFFISIWIIGILACSVYFIGFAPKEPTYSEAENRNLAGLPDADIKSIISGEFGEGIEQYLLDNFPKRDYINAKVEYIKSKLSIATYEEFLAIADEMKDPLDEEVDLGDIDDLLSEEPTIPNEEPTSNPNGEKPSEPNEETTKPDDEKPSIEAEYPPIEPKPEVTLDDFKDYYGVYMDTGKGLTTIHSFSKKNIAAFTKVLDKYAALLPEGGKLMFTFVVQSHYTNRYVSASNKVSYYGDWDDIVNAYSADNVYAFDSSEILGEAAKGGNYITFRTDNHWTPYGAYQVYKQMAERAGVTPADYFNDFIQDVYTPFRGTYYRDNPSAYENVKPDTLNLLTPKFATEVRRTTSKDNYKVIDFIDYNAKVNDRYTMYIGGPAGPWTNVVTDNGKTENCLLVTDSFGLCAIPFFATNYNEVHYYDARYYNADKVGYSVAEMIEKHNIKDIYVIIADFHTFDSSFIITKANKHLYNK